MACGAVPARGSSSSWAPETIRVFPASMIEFSMRLSRERLRSARPLPTSVRSPALRFSVVKTDVRTPISLSANPSVPLSLYAECRPGPPRSPAPPMIQSRKGSDSRGQDVRGWTSTRQDATPLVLTPVVTPVLRRSGGAPRLDDRVPYLAFARTPAHGPTDPTSVRSPALRSSGTPGQAWLNSSIERY